MCDAFWCAWLDRLNTITHRYSHGTGAVILGWDQGVKGMRVGGKRRLIIPAELGYGSTGVPNVIPANSTLYLSIEVVSVVS